LANLTLKESEQGLPAVVDPDQVQKSHGNCLTDFSAVWAYNPLLGKEKHPPVTLGAIVPVGIHGPHSPTTRLGANKIESVGCCIYVCNGAERTPLRARPTIATSELNLYLVTPCAWYSFPCKCYRAGEVGEASPISGREVSEPRVAMPPLMSTADAQSVLWHC
jgi:hypothetical protein